MNNNLLKNKTVQFVIGLSLGILVLVIILSPKRTVSPSFPAPSGARQSGVGSPSLLNLGDQKRVEAAKYVESIKSKLPLYQEGFKTSVGLDTTINIYRLETDDPAIVRLEIYGLSYMNKDANPQKNPNVTAFKESYLKGISLLESVNIDPKRLTFVYSDVNYIKNNTQIWLDALKLQP